LGEIQLPIIGAIFVYCRYKSTGLRFINQKYKSTTESALTLQTLHHTGTKIIFVLQ